MKINNFIQVVEVALFFFNLKYILLKWSNNYENCIRVYLYWLSEWKMKLFEYYLRINKIEDFKKIFRGLLG